MAQLDNPIAKVLYRITSQIDVADHLGDVADAMRNLDDLIYLIALIKSRPELLDNFDPHNLIERCNNEDGHYWCDHDGSWMTPAYGYTCDICDAEIGRSGLPALGEVDVHDAYDLGEYKELIDNIRNADVSQ